jgi:hypothetical protein
VRPADYYRRLAARVRRLADEATTAAIKSQLYETVRKYERLAARADMETPPTEP